MDAFRLVSRHPECERLVGVFLALSILSGCAAGVPRALGPHDIPDAFTGNQSPTAPSRPQLDWWKQAACPELVGFIAAAEKDNLDLSVATAHVLEAQAQLTIQRAALFPQFAAGAQIARTGGSDQISTLPLPPLTSPPPSSGRGLVTAYGATLSGNYQVDLWGLTRANVRSAAETAKVARFLRDGVALTIVSDVANTYLTVLTLRKRIELATENTAAVNELLDVIRLRVTTGTSSRLDLAREEAQVQAIASRIPVLQSAEQGAIAALAVLLGRNREGLEISTTCETEALHPPPISPGVPSDLLTRRPDIAAAEATLASAHANVAAARAAFLPQVDLTGNGLFLSSVASMLFRGPNLAWDLGASVVQTIFDGGGLIGRKRLAVATQEEMISSYRLTILNAFAEVESALQAVADLQSAEAYLLKEVTAAREAFEITQLQYREGAGDLLAVLQAQETLFAAQDQLAQTELTRMQSALALYQALGGGWSEPPDAKTQPQTPATIATSGVHEELPD